ncbi:hypothetical protein BIY45_04800 [Stenotrophomonas sp. BIIR7]|nr:hypothetical protein BIY45_04800 [Stenotrophomonas sp. BIIR7]
MKQHHGALGQLRLPRLKIAAHGLVGVQSVDVKNVNSAVIEVCDSLFETHAHQTGEIGVVALVIVKKRQEHFVAVLSRMLVTFPRIHRIAERRRRALLDSLAERQVRGTAMCAQLNQDSRTHLFHQPGSEWNVPHPRTLGHVAWLHEH